MIKAMILDKEKIAADMLIKMLETYNEIEVTGCYTDAK